VRSGNLYAAPGEREQAQAEPAYDIRMQYSPIDLRTGRPFNDDSPLPSIFDAVQEQLGLKLEPTKAMVEMMVIDHADATPTENGPTAPIG
jgi:uncharacterized protein (TIGR03435 family)